MRLVQVLQLVVDAASRDLQLRLIRMQHFSLFDDGHSEADIILFLVYLAQVKKRLNVVIMLHRRKQLLLRLLQKVQMVVALPQGQLPPRILVIVELSCVTGEFQALLKVVLDEEEVLEDEAGFGPALGDLAEVCL